MKEEDVLVFFFAYQDERQSGERQSTDSWLLRERELYELESVGWSELRERECVCVCLCEEVSELVDIE